MVELEVFKQVNINNYEQLAVIDQFKSLVVNRRYYQANDFELKITLNMDNLDYLKVGNAIRINDIFYYINRSSVPELETGELVVMGVSFFGLLNNRIVWENYSRQARPEVIARDLLSRHVVNPKDNANKVHQISLAPEVNLGSSSVQFQNSYGIVREQVEKLCETHDFGFRELMADPYVPSASIEFYKGKDLSNSVEFTTDAENVISESFEQSDFDERNVALVAGEGEGAERKIVVIDDGHEGLGRKVLYVDARDLQSENDGVVMSDLEYEQALIQRGREKLAEHNKVLILDGDINVHNQLYEYGVDYDLGDIVRRSSPTFKLAYNARITEIQEIYENGLQIVPTFGKRSPTLIDMIKRK